MGGVRRRGVVSLALLLGCALSGFGASVALATNFGSNTASESWPAHPCDGTNKSQCVADGTLHEVYLYNNVTGGIATAIRTAISYYDTNTDSNMIEYPFTPDVNVQIGSFSTVDALAWTQCSGAATYGGSDPNRYCVPQQLIWNTYYESGWYSTQGKKDHIACHELGHSLGLRHTSRTSTCMRVATIVPNSVPTTKVLDSHDIGHVNARY
jgi:hypothetical protein